MFHSIAKFIHISKLHNYSNSSFLTGGLFLLEITDILSIENLYSPWGRYHGKILLIRSVSITPSNPSFSTLLPPPERKPLQLSITPPFDTPARYRKKFAGLPAQRSSTDSPRNLTTYNELGDPEGVKENEE